jgi:hypothetical protein
VPAATPTDAATVELIVRLVLAALGWMVNEAKRAQNDC